MSNPDKHQEPNEEPVTPEKQPGKTDPTPVQPPPDKPEIPPPPPDVPERDVPRKPADPQAGERAFDKKEPNRK
ncbi:hypothetical protein [Chitinophaga nivalis]|uniref:Uncharacterized protein n=1 Tax=Chitinophaga nivalis TaxID=2991709 RepID=A0ABT3IVX2_9BACT|nr:hypothetical protein [Chitinophaga nivalis]MCW3462181.1 hypothetical protein [Chitinophaga nivalis]MCW3488127.1 hypothetical protein [Chitinophaga nivalis]